MKRLPAILVIIGLILLANWFLETIIVLSSFIRFTLVLALALFLILVTIFINLQEKKRGFIPLKKKILFWAICITIIGLLFFYLKPLIKKFYYGQASEIMNRIYWANRMFYQTKWLGVSSIQYPNDNWVMQEIISEVKPDFIVETGTAEGGTTLFYATVLEKVNPGGKVITVDIDPQIKEAGKFQVFRDKVEVIKGDSVSAEVIDAISKRVKNCKVLVTLDSLHTKKHVLKELNLYSNFVSLNSYIVVQDTYWGEQKDSLCHVKGGGPREAMEEFLKNNKNFEIDHSKEKYFITQHPSGFLKRIR